MTIKDRMDQRILQELVADGRMSNVDLADRVGLSPSACLRRVQELQRSGVISGYRAVLDPIAAGTTFIAYITIGLFRHTKTAQLAFEEGVLQSPEIKECHNITGTVEYLLRVEVADLAAYKSLHTDVLSSLPEVNSITTYVVMASPKNQRG